MPRLIAVTADTSRGMLELFDAVWADGDAVLPVAASMPARVRDDLLARVRPAALRDEHGVRDLEDAPPVPDDTALVVTTSGSTGTPRALVHSHRGIAAAVSLCRARLDVPDGIGWLGLLPLHHVAGITLALRSRAGGVEPVLHERDTPEVVATAAPSWISLVPQQLQRLLDADVDLARHHGVLLGGAAVSRALLTRARATGARVVETYGMTETCGGVVYDGEPLDGIAVRTDTDGRIHLRTPTIATGLRAPSGAVTRLTDDEGWFATADRGELVDGRLVVHGRMDDVAISGGVNVALGPVRDAVRQVVGRDHATVVALPDDRWGQAVTAVVTSDRAVGLDELRKALTETLPATHRPTQLVIADQLPTDQMGKTTPASVQQAVADGAARAVRHDPA